MSFDSIQMILLLQNQESIILQALWTISQKFIKKKKLKSYDFIINNTHHDYGIQFQLKHTLWA